jgi:phospholipase/lecithinase/hemolysin
MRCTAFVVVMAVVLLSFAQRAEAQSFSQVIVFGDSNVDTGWYRQLPSGSTPGGEASFNADWPTAVAQGAGVPTTSFIFTPPSISVEFLAGYLGLTANPANTAGGTNYATSGAKNDTANFGPNGGFTASIPTGTQIRNYLSAHGNVADSKALYVIWSGDNDVSYANGDIGTAPPPNPYNYLLEYAEDLAGDILILKNAGAQNIIVAGLAYDFPMGTSTDAVNHRALKLYYTQQLFQNLTNIGVPYIPANIDALRLAIFNNPSLYGFTNVGTGAGQMACSQPAGVTTSWALLCSASGFAPSTFDPNSGIAMTDLFADNEHLAYAGQQLVGFFLYNLVAQKESPLLAAVLPASRSAQPNGTVTAFATIINTAPTAAKGCSIAPAFNTPASFSYQTTNPATNALTGTPNTPVNIPGNNGLQTFVIAFKPSRSFLPGATEFVFSCTNLPPAPVVVGLNTLLMLSASTTTASPDVIALGATINNDGIVHVTNGSPATGVFAVATDNLGSGDTITVAATTGATTLPVTIALCQTNPTTGVCLQTPAASVVTQINSGATPTFGFFVTASGTVPFDPTNNRIFVTFTDSTNAVRGETSVAVETM